MGAFAVSTPSPTVVMTENRAGEVAFSVTNTSGRSIRTRATIVPIDGTPKEWFDVSGKPERDLPAGRTEQFTVRVEPPLGTPAGSHSFRLDAIGVERPDEDYAEGPACSFVVTASQPKITTPRGYVATLVGATAGGILGELVIVFGFRTSGEEEECEEVGCAFGQASGELIALAIAVVLGLFLMWVGAALGSWVGLRVRRFLGSKTTALFLAVLMVPWTILVLALLGGLIPNLVVGIVIAPILLITVPAVLARGAVLLIRTRHI